MDEISSLNLLLNQMFSAERKPRRGFPATSLDQPVSTFKTGVLGSLVGLKLLILRWYQIEATRQREIDFHIPKTLTKSRVALCLTQPFCASSRDSR
jgi:hypothetical protein